MATPSRLERPAFYALRPGGWRDLLTLLHPPYTAWHLSYVAIGAAVAPRLDGHRLLWTLLAFLLAVGVAAHALDELHGRPLQTNISDRVLIALTAVSLAGAIAIGVVGAVSISYWLLAFVAVGVLLVLAYNLELLGGRMHSDLWFALAWGAFPAFTAFWVQAGEVRVDGVLVAAACLMLSMAQRRLSTPVRELRRRTVSLHGRAAIEQRTHDRAGRRAGRGTDGGRADGLCHWAGAACGRAGAGEAYVTGCTTAVPTFACSVALGLVLKRTDGPGQSLAPCGAEYRYRDDRHRRQPVPQGPARVGDPERRLATRRRVRRRGRDERLVRRIAKRDRRLPG